MLPITLALLAASAAASAGTAVAVLRARRRPSRAERLRGLAKELGMSFEPLPALGSIPETQRFELFTQGEDREMRHVLRGERDGRRVELFDYSFVRGAGGRSARWRHTVVHVHDPALRLPAFLLRPENVVHRVGERFFQDIDLMDAPEFSRDFLLQGTDEDAVRRAFGPAVRAVLAGEPRAFAEGQGADLFLWRGAGPAEPEAVPGLLNAASALADAFGAAQNPGTSIPGRAAG
ncbi:MAG TPA: hypothetical protein VF665_11355 [Longimicrobium sp.]|jgi:hypothetical protein|uniref:hypothetical protein n=1 Tax=Longimicrobium sp. TaxID=2029185 RepID=UPI002ED89B62